MESNADRPPDVDLKQAENQQSRAVVDEVHRGVDINGFRQWYGLMAKNNELVTVVKSLMSQVEEIKGKMKEAEERFKARQGLPTKPKRHRRKADQIDRLHTCPTCSKSYGSEGSLIQHMKLKHEVTDDQEEDSRSS